MTRRGRRGAAPWRWVAAIVVGLALPAWLVAGAWARGEGRRSVVGSAHDLSFQPGRVESSSAGSPGVCAFCHGTHATRRARALWNRETPVRAYVPYSSPTMDARPGQPDGVSKLCLSCHDGVVATNTSSRAPWFSARVMRSSRVRGPGLQPPPLTGGTLLGPPPASGRVAPVIGPYLADDHPISFRYDAALALRDGQLAVPEETPTPMGRTIAEAMLDARGRLQCTSCHNAHDDAFGAFLRWPNRSAELCTICHTRWQYDLSAHAAPSSSRFADNCRTCHRPHDAARASPLLVAAEPELCGGCHREQADRMRRSAPTRHVTIRSGALEADTGLCSSCHDPHLVRPGAALDRPILTDPDDPARPPRLLPSSETPFSYVAQPRMATEARDAFCLDCHDGTWPGAIDVAAELRSRGAPQTNFRIGNHGLHATHAASSVHRNEGVGCTYCHDSHGSRGNRGLFRGKLLYPWLIVNEFPYRSKRSCSTNDVLGRCHGS